MRIAIFILIIAGSCSLYAIQPETGFEGPVHNSDLQSELLPPIRLDSGVQKTIDKSFILEPKNIKDIVTVLVRATRSLNTSCQVVYIYTRRDDRYFKLDSVDRILSDPNSSPREIDTVGFYLYDLKRDSFQGGGEPRRILKLVFSGYKSPGVSLDISGGNLDWALLLADDLVAEIDRTTVSSWNVANCLIAIFAFLTVLFVLILLFRFTSFNQQVSTLRGLMVTFVWQMLLALFVFGLLGLFLQWASVHRWLHTNEGIFLWGDMIKIRSEQVLFSNGLLWSVFVAFFVSLFANIVSIFLQNRQSTKEK